MENKGLLFIPDISGFTRFIADTEINHSRLIIQELLEVLINANKIGLEISEIEGDAILFYKFGEAPKLEELFKQVEEMFCAFHGYIKIYDKRRYCQCKACIAAVNLSLKVVTHYGEFTGYNVKNFNKLIGKDVIVAHQLLKNDIVNHEYWLVTNDLYPGDKPTQFTHWMEWNRSAKQTETGEVPFTYTQLTPLKDQIAPIEPVMPDLSNKTKIASATREYATDFVILFHGAGNFMRRSQWLEGVVEVEELHHYLPRVGMRARIVNEKGDSVIFSSGYSYKKGEQFAFSEADEKTGNLTYFTIDKIDKNRSKLTIEFYTPKSFLGNFFNGSKKKKMQASLTRSLEKLDKVVKDVQLPEGHDDDV
jgi:hypothetical protein